MVARDNGALQTPNINELAQNGINLKTRGYIRRWNLWHSSRAANYEQARYAHVLFWIYTCARW